MLNIYERTLARSVVDTQGLICLCGNNKSYDDEARFEYFLFLDIFHIDTSAHFSAHLAYFLELWKEPHMFSPFLLVEQYFPTFSSRKSHWFPVMQAGQTPLHIAAINNFGNMAKLLIEQEANVDIKDNKDGVSKRLGVAEGVKS